MKKITKLILALVFTSLIVPSIFANGNEEKPAMDSMEQGKVFLANYRSGLYGYTYLEE